MRTRIYFEYDIVERNLFALGEDNYAELKILSDETAWEEYLAAERAFMAASRRLHAAMQPAEPLDDEERAAIKAWQPEDYL